MWRSLRSPNRGIEPLDAEGTAAAAVDDRGNVVAWAPAARKLLGYSADEIHGMPMRLLLADPDDWEVVRASRGGWARLRDRHGASVTVRLDLISLESGAAPGGPHTLVLASPSADVRSRLENDALIRELLTRDHPDLVVLGPDLDIHQAGPAWGDVIGKRLSDTFVAEDAAAVEERLRRVAETGDPLVNWAHDMRTADRPDIESVRSLTAFRLTDRGGGLVGVAAVSSDVTAYHRSQRRLDLLHRAMSDIGISLDVSRTAEALVGVLVPEFGCWATADLAVAVIEGDPLPSLRDPWPMRQRLASVAAAREGVYVDMERRAKAIDRMPESDRVRRLRAGEALLTRDISTYTPGTAEEAGFLASVYPAGTRSVIVAPLYIGEGLLGVFSVVRTGDMPLFDEEDLTLIEEIIPRASLNLNNAWQYAREHRRAVALQRSLLPESFDETTAATVVGSYLSADAESGVGGDWFDAIPLSSLRTAFVVGDVVGHGLQATATMGRLRTAVQSFADLDLDPEELLARLNDLTSRMSDEHRAADGTGGDTAGATCLYAVYDPVSGLCSLASAGHPPPVLVRPDGSVEFIEMDPGPPLGVGGMPFEATRLDLAPGSLLAFYTDGLVGGGGQDIDEGMEKLRLGLSAAHCRDADLHDLSREVVSALKPDHPTDDAALLLARTRTVPTCDTVFWELPADESIVGEARKLVTGQLSAWHLDDLVITAEIVVSELVTNAVRHAVGPVCLRLTRDGVLVCEVTDASNTQPRLRRAHSTDEGGRGLFIVAQLVRRWGCRYKRSGKTIWVELALSGEED